MRRENNGLSNNRRRDVIHRKARANWRLVRLKPGCCLVASRDDGDAAVIVDDVIVIFIQYYLLMT